MFDCIISVDCGLTGGITFLFSDGTVQIFKMPVVSIKRNKKNKNVYDVKKITEIYSLLKEKNVLLAIERQSSRRGEGSVSSFTSGEGYGILQGIGHALGYTVEIISPISWKKHYVEFNCPEIQQFKEKRNEINRKIKNIQDKDIKNEYKKETEKISNKIRRLAKGISREIAQKNCPFFKDELKKVSDDGKSDALLMGLYVRDNDKYGVVWNKNRIRKKKSDK